MHVIERLKAPTPRFFARLRDIGLAMATVAGMVLTTPLVLPAALVTVASYVGLAGGIISAVSQLSVSDGEHPNPPENETDQEEQKSQQKKLLRNSKNKEPSFRQLLNFGQGLHPLNHQAYGP